ncbi:MAG TPA: M48 family metallopeptidase [Chloroflexia bacterium]|nr:M48 family metallopeptidase [Chloroflexia bacterium]
MTVSTEMSEGRRQKAKEYARLRRILFFVNTGLGLAILLVMLLTGLSLELRKVVEGWTGNQWLVVPIYMAIFGGAYAVLTFPLDVYAGYHLPRKYGMLHQNFGPWLRDLAKGGLIAVVIGLVLIEALYFGFRNLGDWWWLIGGIFYLFFVIVMVNLAPVLIMPLFNKFIPLENEELQNRIMRLGEKTGARVKGVYTMDFSRRTNAANAFVTGIGNTRRVVLGDTLTQNYTPDEIEVIMAHELGHHVHGDIWRGIALDSVVTLLGFYIANLVLQAGISGFGFRNTGDVAAFPLFVLVMAAFSLVTMPLNNAFSRARENAADAYALDITKDASSFISSMKKLANQNLADTDPPRWVVWLFYTHPPIADRVRRGENFIARGNPYSSGGVPAGD